jgi:hypothetical protein
MLADGVLEAASGDTLRRRADMDRALVLAARRSVVPRVGLSRSPRGIDGAAGVRRPAGVERVSPIAGSEDAQSRNDTQSEKTW